jgi:hypothetical protein
MFLLSVCVTVQYFISHIVLLFASYFMHQSSYVELPGGGIVASTQTTVCLSASSTIDQLLTHLYIS